VSFMAYDLNAIKSGNNIMDVAKELGLEVRGTSARCFRPECHKRNDRSPSLSFDARRNTFRCFVCRDVGGSVIDLVMQVKEMKFREAVEYLAERAGMNAAKSKQDAVDAEPRVDVRKDDDLDAMEAALDPTIFQKVYEVYEFLIESCGGIGREAAKYLHQRGISEETAKKMRLAYISDYGGLCRCRAKKFPQEILGWTGLFNANGRLKFYKHRLLLPFTTSGRVVYLQARALDGRTRPKELNLNRPFPGPFNIDIVKEKALKRVYLCEGVIDTLTLIERRLPAVGIPGCNSFKKEWVRYFRGKEVLICLDSDKPGQSAASYIRDLFVRAKIESRIIVLPSGEDVNSYFEVLRQFEVN
jgi:DNA primase